MTPPPPISTDDLLAHAGWVRALARRIAQDAASAEDLAQGTLSAALARPPAADKPLRPWLARVLTNLARKEQRGAARRTSRERLAARPEPGRAADELLEELEEQQRLARLVTSLPEPYRSVVLRRYYRGESCAQIARADGVPTGTVRSQLARGLERLRVQIERRCGGDRQRTLGVLALAAGERQGLWTPTLLSTTQVIAMSTATKVAALTATVATVCVGTFLLISGPGEGDDVHPSSVAAAVRPAESSEAPEQAPAEESVESGEDQRVAVDEQAVEPESEEPEAEPAPSAPHVVHLRVVDEEGLPIAGAELFPTNERGMARDMPASAPSGPDGAIEVELDRKACFQYMGRENANAYVGVRAPGYATLFFVAMVTLNGRHDQGDRVLAPGGSIAGTVTDSFGAPLLGAEVVVTSALVDTEPEGARLSGPETDGGRPSTWTDATGRFEVGGTHVGAARVWARAEGHQWSFSEAVEVAAGSTVEDVALELELLPDDARIAGFVVDPSGSPVAGAEIAYRSPVSYDAAKVRSAAMGAFSIDLESRQELELITHDPSGRFGPAQPTRVSPGQIDVRIELTPLRTIQVRAEDESGRPLEDVGVIAIVADNDADYMNQKWIHTDAAGRVEILARGAPFEVCFSETGYEYLKLGPFDPEALPDGEIVGRLEREPSVHGIVLHEGEPVEGASVDFVQTFPGDSREFSKGFPSRYWDSGSLDEVRTDAEGRFTVAVDLKERMEAALLVEKEGLALAEVPLEKPDDGEDFDEIEVRLGPGGSIAGHVRVPPSRSQNGVVIGISRGDGRPRFMRTDGAGQFRFDNLTPGPWRVEDRAAEPEGRVTSIKKNDEAPFDYNCDVVEGEVTNFVVDLRWQEDLQVHGRLVIDGAGAQGWSAVLTSAMGADRDFHLRPTLLDEEGRFAAEAVPGHAQLVLSSPAGETPVRRLISKVRVVEGLEPAEFAFQTGSMAGRVEEGESRMRYHFNVDGNTHIEAEFATDPDAAFEVSGVPVGEVSLQREYFGTYGKGWYSHRSVQVVAGQTAEVY